jgi:hypothetical protein
MQLLQQLNALEKLSNNANARGAGSSDDPFSLFDSSDSSEGNLRTRGTEGLDRIRRGIANNPEAWNRHFDDEIMRQCFAHVTGGSWSLYDYVLKRIQFTKEQEDLERVTHMFCALHAQHRLGPENHEALGATLRQCFKAVEQAARDKSDWTLAWLWCNMPDPRPRQRYARGLAHPAEHSAGIAYLRELSTLQNFREDFGANRDRQGDDKRDKNKGKDKKPDDVGANNGDGGRGGDRGRGRGRGRGGEVAGGNAAGAGQ